MDFVFRNFVVADAPSAGELWLRPRKAEQHRPDFAALALEQGPAAFASGEGPTRQIVIQAAPTLDDMLAATILEQRLSQKPLPANMGAYAKYTGMVREGLRPSKLAPEVSLEGIYLAIRNFAGPDLTAPEAGSRFRADWGRMADCILQSAEAGKDPFTVSLFAEGADFARERVFLADDHKLYRQDVLAGERWKVRIPGGPEQASGLIFQRPPRSILWKHWSRSDPGAPVGGAYLFLGLFEEPRHWRFSIDPIQRVSLKPLAEQLQNAEARVDPEAASQDPWFDGKRFGYTLIGAPRGGTKLSDAQVLRIVRRWARASRPRDWKKPAIAGVAALVIIALLPSGTFRRVSHQLTRGLEALHESPADGGAGAIQAAHAQPDLYLLSIGVSRYAAGPRYDLDFADNDASATVETFKRLKGNPFREVYCEEALTNEEATKPKIIEQLESLGRRARNASANDLVVVTMAGHGRKYMNEFFCFLPHDFDPEHELYSSISWDEFKKPLFKLPCLVLVVMDTCHSGTITHKDELPKGDQGMVVVAACMKDQKARETRELKHGLLTEALLEGITGQFQLAGVNPSLLLAQPEQSERSYVSLKELDFYLGRRVEALAGTNQAVVSNNTGNLPTDHIPVGARKVGGSDAAPKETP